MAPHSPQITGEDVTITSSADPTVKYSDAKSGSSITYSFTATREGFVCLDFDVTDRNSYTVYHNGEKLYSESLSLTQMIAACDCIPGDIIEVKLTCKQGEEGRMTVRAAILDDALFRRGWEILNHSTLQITEFDTTRIVGIVDADRDGLLYTSIPQNGNWLVEVDGEPAEIKLVGECMIGVDLTEGEHTVTFRYHNAAFALGWKISLGCAAVFLLLVQLVYKPDWKTILKKNK